MSNWHCQLGFRSGFGFDLEVIPTQAAYGVEHFEEGVEPDVHDMTIGGFELRLPFIVIMLTEVTYADE